MFLITHVFMFQIRKNDDLKSSMKSVLEPWELYISWKMEGL